MWVLTRKIKVSFQRDGSSRKNHWIPMALLLMVLESTELKQGNRQQVIQDSEVLLALVPSLFCLSILPPLSPIVQTPS